MVNNKYADSYKEVLIVLNNLIKEDYEKIPKEYIEFLENNANPNYDFKYDVSKAFDEQELLEDTKYILFGLFEKFWATEVQKLKIKSFKDNYNEKLEKEKREKYKPDDIFNNKAKIAKINEDIPDNQENIEMIEYNKPKWYQKIFEKILKILKKN